jgi:hypothetical protein
MFEQFAWQLDVEAQVASYLSEQAASEVEMLLPSDIGQDFALLQSFSDETNTNDAELGQKGKRTQGAHGASDESKRDGNVVKAEGGE